MIDALISALKDFLHFIRDIEPLIARVGTVGLHLIVFAETGLLAGFFLPGDSLLFIAGALAAAGKLNVWVLLFGLSIAAIAGDQTGYLIGRKLGHALYKREDSRLFKRKHLEAAHAFYEKYGGKAIIMARFVPIIRTFAPTVAGAAEMNYRKFITYNVVGGIAWVFSMVGGGYFLGQIEFVKKNIEKVALGIVFLSVLPIVFEMWKAHRRPAAEGPTAA